MRPLTLLLTLLGGLLLLSATLACAPTATTAPPVAASRETPPAEEEEEDETDAPSGAAPGSAPTATPRPLPTSTIAPGLKTEVVAEGLLFPSALSFAPDGRLFFVEVKKGQVRVIANRQLQPEPVASIEVARGTEHGLVGLALDPGFAQNHYLYTFYTQVQQGNDDGRPRRNRLTRWVERDGVASDETNVLKDLPVGKCCHTGGKMVFAGDGNLYLTVGDQGDADRRDAQNPNKANGKLLRFDVAQVMAEDPKPASLAVASGFRNPYGLDIHPVTGDVFVTDNGPDMCDELNLVKPGGNYGNPMVECSPHDPEFGDPIWDSGPDRLGITGLRIYRGTMFPELRNHVLFCAVNTGNMAQVVLEAPGYDRVAGIEQIVSGSDGEGCRLDLAEAPDGSIYYSSVTKIYRLYR